MGAYREHARGRASIVQHIGMPRVGVDVAVLANAQHGDVVELGVQLDRSFEHVDEFFAVIAQQRAELPEIARGSDMLRFNR